MRTINRMTLYEDAVAAAAKSLEPLLNTRLKVEVLSVVQGSVREMIQNVKSRNDKVVGAKLPFAEKDSYAFFCMSGEDAENVIACTESGTQGKTGSTIRARGAWTERDRSVITEISNIFLGSFINVIADVSKESIKICSPQFVNDSTGAVLNKIATQMIGVSPLVTRVEICMKAQNKTLGMRLLWFKQVKVELAAPEPIDSILLDGMAELASIGAAYASDTVSKLTGFKVDVDVPRVLMLGADANMAVRKINVDMQNSVTISHAFNGRKVSGDLVVVLEQQHLKKLALKSVQEDFDQSVQPAYSQEVAIEQKLKHFAETIAGSFLMAMGRDIGIVFAIDISRVYYEPFENVLSRKIEAVGVDRICVFVVNFKLLQRGSERKDVTGYLCILFDRTNIHALLDALKRKLPENKGEERYG